MRRTAALRAALPVLAPGVIRSSGTYLIARVSVVRSEEHTSELQSQSNLVCRLLLEKKKTNKCTSQTYTLAPPSPHVSYTPRYPQTLPCSNHKPSLPT